MFSSVRVDSRALMTGKKPLRVSYGQVGICKEERVRREPVHGHPFDECVQGTMNSGQETLWAVNSERRNVEEQNEQTMVFSGHSV